MGRWRPVAGHGTALAMVRSPPPRTPLAGGSLIAIGAIAGTGIGLFSALGPTRGFLIGLGIGAAISIVMCLRDVRR